MGLCESQGGESVVSLLLSLSLLRLVGAENAGGKSFLCQENRAANSYSTFLPSADSQMTS